MKYLILLLLVAGALHAQEQDTIARKEPQKEYFRLYYALPGAVGNNVIAKANEGARGAGIAVTLYAENNFHGIVGYEKHYYDVTDVSLAGNAQETRITNLYAGLLYKIPVGSRLAVNPMLTIGYINIAQSGPVDKKFGRQEGLGISPSADIDFTIAGGLRVFAGITYTLSFPETQTNPQYKSFYGTIQQVNVTFGIKL